MNKGLTLSSRCSWTRRGRSHGNTNKCSAQYRAWQWWSFHNVWSWHTVRSGPLQLGREEEAGVRPANLTKEKLYLGQEYRLYLSRQKVELMPFQEGQAGMKATKNATGQVLEMTGVSRRLEVDYEARSNWMRWEIDTQKSIRWVCPQSTSHNSQLAEIRCLLCTQDYCS